MNNYIETAISLILIFFIFSVIAYVIQEIIAVNLQYRGKVLYKSLSQLLDNANLKGRAFLAKKIQVISTPNTDGFYEHPQIASLKKHIDRLPAYIPAANFSLALLDIIAKQANVSQAQGSQLDKIRSGLTTFITANGNIGVIVKNLVDTSTSIDELQLKLETWYCEYMDRVTGWYKSHTILTLRLIALGVTLFFNVDVIKLSKNIFNNATLRGKMVAIAEQVTESPETVAKYYTQNFDQEIARIDAAYKPALDTLTDETQRSALLREIKDNKIAAADLYTQKRVAVIDSLSKQLAGTGIPLGWNESFFSEYDPTKTGFSLWNYVWLVLGWLIAAGCIAMGAPFWFDLLVKAVNLRRTGIKPTANDTKRQ